MSVDKRVVVLISGTPSNLGVEQNQRRMIDAINGAKLKHIIIDGGNSENVEIRNQLFKISEKRAVYPQCFIENTSNNEYTFIGDWEGFEGLLECESIPKDVLDANPNIMTFSKVFNDIPREN
eukprot:TRINITY_DN120745_c0_g1_i1.p1 TRINITY_DN120745_c0_g1~~TRINITY_DN120745_c0_g1_i1.p1  ORF type:complete len:122 (-),score=2.99 TRINITY_DN120745_c0_g1_i1:45-410(-)